MLTVKFVEKTLEDIRENINSFVGKIIDISDAPDVFSANLDIGWASTYGITSKQLSIQVIENRIHEIASAANIPVVCFFKEQVEKETSLLNQLLPGRIILLK